MATQKTNTVLADNVTLTAGAADVDSATWDLQDGYGGLLMLKITNGATGPTVAAQCQVKVSGDNINWYNLPGPWPSAIGNNVVSSTVIMVPIGAKYLKVTSGSNTGQNVTIRIAGVEVTDVNA